MLCSNLRQKSSGEPPAVLILSVGTVPQRPSVVPKTMRGPQTECSVPAAQVSSVHETHFTLAMPGLETAYGCIQL